MTGPRLPVTVTGRTPWSGFIRYHLSNGWFIDGASLFYRRHMGYKYALFEPGGDPSGCAGFRGGAPTLKLAVAVANGAIVCSRADWGCRKTAVAFRTVTVRGTEGKVFRCGDHAGEEDQPLTPARPGEIPDGQAGSVPGPARAVTAPARELPPAALPRPVIRRDNRDSWPEQVRHLPVCTRTGLPIPYATARNPDGSGRWDANDVGRKLQCGRDRLCGLCGRPLGWWAVFLTQDHGQLGRRTLFTDAPLHEDCAVLALAECPFIANRRLPRRADADVRCPAAADPARPKTGWLMVATHDWEVIEQAAGGGGTVWAFRPCSRKRVRRFRYTSGHLTAA